MTGPLRILLVLSALSGPATFATAQEEQVGRLIGPAPDIRCQAWGISADCARSRIDAWHGVFGRSSRFTPDYDRGDGDVLLTADRDMLHEEAFLLSMSRPGERSDDDWAHLEFILRPKVGWHPVQWSGRITAADGHRLMSQVDAALAALPPAATGDAGCIHAQHGAIERARGRDLATYPLDFCEDDGRAMEPVYRAFITVVQDYALGCGPTAGWTSGDLRDLTACLRLRGDRVAAKNAYDAAVRQRTLWEDRVGEAEAKTHLIDFFAFGAGDVAVLTGWWMRLDDHNDDPYLESRRKHFIEVWAPSDGVWLRRSVEGVPPPE